MNHIHWVIVNKPHHCHECNGLIPAGVDFVWYIETPIDSYGKKHLHIKRNFCADCAVLLIDSLTTTEDCADV